MRAFMLSLVTLLCGPAAAADAPAGMVTASLLSGWRMQDGRHMAGFRLELAPGWKTYWRAPGDAGIPPRFDWSRSENVAAVAVHWPVPVVFGENGLRSIGYTGGVVFPIEVTPVAAGAPVRLEATVELGVCEDICVPVTVTVRSALAETGGVGGEAIRAALARRPMTAAEAGAAPATCALEPTRDGLRVTVTLDVPPLAREEAAVVELADPAVWVSEATVTRAGNRLSAVADLVPPSMPFAVSRDDLSLTVLGAGRGLEIHGCRAG